MTPLNTIIEEESTKFGNLYVEVEEVMERSVLDRYERFLTTAMQRACEAGRAVERERIRKWATSNARTKDTNMSDFPENHEYTVDYHELTDFLSKQL